MVGSYPYQEETLDFLSLLNFTLRDISAIIHMITVTSIRQNKSFKNISWLDVFRSEQLSIK